MTELYIWGGALGFVGALFAYLIWLIRADAKSYIELEQAEVLLKDIADANKQARKSAKIINAMSDAELNDSLRRKKNK